MDREPRDAVPFAARVRLLRARLGLSQEQLARQLGVSFATVNRWESGRSRPSARTGTLLGELAGATGLAGGGSGPVVARTTRLPAAQSSFVGRERELGELTGLLARSRLITLTGPGGAGKTRLAVETARRWAAGTSEDSTVFVSLEHVRPPQSAASAMAARLRLRDRPGVPVTETLLAALGGAPVLLLVDRAEEHRAELGALLGELLPAAPGLRVLVTSRVILGIAGEVCWAVPPLDCPAVTASADDVSSRDAVRLFGARAAERLPGFTITGASSRAVGELCRRLGGLPLAIELIAGWVATLSVTEILAQRTALLDYRRPEGRKLGDVLRASYELLDRDPQRVLQMLSVFAEPVAVPDAAAVLGLPEAETAAAIRALVDSSWLVVIRGTQQNQFTMVEIVRTFAAGRLAEADERTA